MTERSARTRAIRLIRGGAFTLLAVAGLGRAPDAAACGGFFSPHAVESARRPSLSYEQTLIVFDEEAHREHFVREIVFTRSIEPFGFVVPTPTRPEVHKAKSPFASLRADFPFETRPRGIGLGTLSGIGHGAGGGTGVQVLEEKRVGSFTAFVLAADDEQALARWLKDNGLTTTKETEPWLRHYVARKFYFVAMRYEPPSTTKLGLASGGTPTPPTQPRTLAETVRISFDTPAPYYPYFEPPRPAPLGKDPGRLMEVWLVAARARSPVAARKEKGAVTWVRPLAEGARYDAIERAKLARPLGGEQLLPKGPLIVQRFMDQKRSREGYGDIVFVPRAPGPENAAHRAALHALVSTLDPTLLPPAPPAGAPSSGPTIAPVGKP